jgi:hypothetical protein
MQPDLEPVLEWEIAALGHFPEDARELRQLISLLAKAASRDTLRVELTGDTGRRVLNQLHAMPQRVATQLILLSATGYADCLQAPTPGHLGVYRLALPQDPP